MRPGNDYESRDTATARLLAEGKEPLHRLPAHPLFRVVQAHVWQRSTVGRFGQRVREYRKCRECGQVRGALGTDSSCRRER